MTAIHLETERPVLRKPVPADAEHAAALLTDREVMRFLGATVVPEEATPGFHPQQRAALRSPGYVPLVGLPVAKEE